MHECCGCYNKARRLNSGQPFTKEMEDKIIADLNDTRIHRQDLAVGRRSAASAKRTGYPDTGTTYPRGVPGKDIWVWTGYKLDELNAAQMQVVDLINVLVDGKFVQDLKDPALIWRGSSNR